VVCNVFDKRRDIKSWTVINTCKLEYNGGMRYFECKGKICINSKDDLSGEDVILRYIDTKEQKYKYRMGFVTPIVYTLTYVYLIVNDGVI
jgi:hypothetical protein